MYSEDDTDNSEDDNFTNFDKYDLNLDKSLDFKNDVVFRRNKTTLSSYNYEMRWLTRENKRDVRRKDAEKKEEEAETSRNDV